MMYRSWRAQVSACPGCRDCDTCAVERLADRWGGKKEPSALLRLFPRAAAEPTSNGSDAYSNHLEETPPAAAATAKPMGEVALNRTLNFLV
ncbi:unnamed protein product [Ectocarpus sp. 6 AP-2014]